MTDLGKARTADRNFPIARYRWGKTRVEGEREKDGKQEIGIGITVVKG